MSEISGLTNEEVTVIHQAQKDAVKAFRVLRETRTISASGTVSFIHRIPGTEKLINLVYPGPFADDLDTVQTYVFDFAGTVYLGDPKRAGVGRYTALFQEHPDVTTVSHVHTPHLGAYSQAHAELAFLYVPVQRHRFVRKIPVYVDRRQPEVKFILDQLKIEKELPGIVEANGGATVWGKKGIIALAEFILILEEGAYFQVLGAALGGSQPLGPGVLQQQWRMSGLVPRTAIVDQDGKITYAEAAE
jgi:ribulose-5-phosphate 4-epimerase/fuculose-1-phosphate aldolase